MTGDRLDARSAAFSVSFCSRRNAFLCFDFEKYNRVNLLCVVHLRYKRPRESSNQDAEMPHNLNHVREQLLREKTEILAAQEASAESRQPVELDQQAVGRLSRMDAMQQQAMALETGRRRKRRLGLIDAALKRIEDGTFGYCAICDEEIWERRLSIDLTVTRCVGCAQ